ncbi:MAG: ATP synthase F1 subunit gamma [Bacteroidetes bacterium]|nr:ATP synthase F1 subunit gamma [Bacteroidota bacterium]
MESLKDIRSRIVSVQSTRQITSAMKMVSASKLRKAQKAIIQLRPYSSKLYGILQHLSSLIENNEENAFLRKSENSTILIICISSNKGLCGAFNTNIFRKAEEIVKTKYADEFVNDKIHFSVVGKKVFDQISSSGWKIIDNNNQLFDNLDYKNVSELAQKYMDLFLEGTYDRIEIIYNRFKNAAVQEICYDQYLPINIDDTIKNDGLSSDFILEPDIDHLNTHIIPLSLKIQLYSALLDSVAAEHGARMTAMHIATDNATNIISDLRLQYNKARQASITNEILEIVGGAEALRS